MRFTIRDMLWLMVIVGLCVALWVERQQRYDMIPSQFPMLTDSQIIEAWRRESGGNTGAELIAAWKRGNVSIEKRRIAEYDVKGRAPGQFSRVHHTNYRCVIRNKETEKT